MYFVRRFLTLTITLCSIQLSGYGQDLGDAFTPDNFVLPTMPKGLSADVSDVDIDPKTGEAEFGGAITLQSDNGMKLKASNGSFNYKKQTGILRGHIALTQKATDESYGIQVFSDRAEIDHKSKTVILSGNVSLYTGEALHRGEKAFYNYETREFKTANMRTGIDPILLESDKFRSEEIDGKQVFIGNDAGLTTHDAENPDFWLRADRTTVFPGEKVVFKNLKVQAGGRTIFWLPYLSQPLDTDLGYTFIPGSRSNLGFFLLNRYGVMLGGERDPVTGENRDAWLLSQWHFDLYSRRGVGFGVDLIDKRKEQNKNLTGLSLYYINDLDASIERSGIQRTSVDDDRFIIRLADKRSLPDIGGYDLVAFANINFISDRHYLEDFQPQVFRTNPQPDNIFGITARDDTSVLNLYARLQLNNFYQADRRLPEITFDQIRRPLFGSSVLHEGQTSLGLYREEIGDITAESLRAELTTGPSASRVTEINNLLRGNRFSRFHTYQEVSLPISNGWFSIVPRAGVGYTAYGDIDGSGSSIDRSHMFAGVDTSLTFSRSYPDIFSSRWGVDGIKHVVQPYAHFSWLRSNELDASFDRIDRLTATTRPLLRGVGRFTAIDDLADWGVFRLGVRNQLLTRRNGSTHQWLTLDTYIDAFTDDPALDRNFSNIYNSLQWNPVPWGRLNFDTQFPIAEGGSGFSEITTGATFMPTPNLEFQINHRYLNNHPILEDSNQIDSRLYARISDLWGVDIYHRWELDDNTLEVQQYQLQRNLSSWTVGAGLLIRDNREKDEYAFLLTFRLNEFPSVSLPLSIDSE